MIKSIEVRFVFHETIHKGFREATEAAVRSTRTFRAKKDNLTLKEVHAVEFSIHGATVELLLSDRRVLRITCADDTVDWHIEKDAGFTDGPQIYADDVILKLPEGKSILWHPNALLRRRLNVRGIAIAPTESTVTLSVWGCSELVFGQMIDSMANQFLFFEED